MPELESHVAYEIQTLTLSTSSANSSFSFVLPGTWERNTQIAPYIHWSTTTDMGVKTAHFLLTWMITQIGDTYSSSTVSVGTNVYKEYLEVTGGVAYRHMMSAFTPRTPTVSTNNAVVMGSLSRYGDVANYTGVVHFLGLRFVIRNNIVGGLAAYNS